MAQGQHSRSFQVEKRFLSRCGLVRANEKILGWDRRSGAVWQAAGKFCLLRKRDPFWRQMGSRLTQSVGENSSGFGSRKTIKEEPGDLFSSLVGVRVVLNEGQMQPWAKIYLPQSSGNLIKD